MQYDVNACFCGSPALFMGGHGLKGSALIVQSDAGGVFHCGCGGPIVYGFIQYVHGYVHPEEACAIHLHWLVEC